MANTMTPSKPITDGQIDKAIALYRAILEKHRAELASDAAQGVLGSSEYVDELYDVLRRRVEAVSDLISRFVSVNRGRTPNEALNATGRNKYVAEDVVQAMPRGAGEKAEVVFFKVGRDISDDDLEKEYALRGLVPADAYSLAAVNENDSVFADDRPNATHWKDANGKWCYAAFNRWRDERDVDVHRDDVRDWRDFWWFAGLRK